MDIGSAKITRSEMSGISHHLIDILEPEEEFNVVRFQKMALEEMEQISICLYTCIESAEIISAPILFASPIDAFVFPTAVGPAKIISGFFIYTILLNFFSNSRFVMAMIVGLPWGQ